MGLSSANPYQTNIDRLTADIAKASAKIRQGHSKTPFVSDTETAETPNSESFTGGGALTSLEAGSSFSLQMMKAENTQPRSRQNLEYAVNSYNYVFNINKEPTVLIDFMHEYNRSFDFMI